MNNSTRHGAIIAAAISLTFGLSARWAPKRPGLQHPCSHFDPVNQYPVHPGGPGYGRQPRYPAKQDQAGGGAGMRTDQLPQSGQPRHGVAQPQVR